MLALANALQDQLRRKSRHMSAVTSWAGQAFIVALLATVLPSAIGLILLLKLIDRFRQSPVVKGMTLSVQPVIAMMMLFINMGNWRRCGKPLVGCNRSPFFAISFFFMTKYKMHTPPFSLCCLFIWRVHSTALKNR
ncbi:chromate transporter [Bacillus sp. SL00103]